jgi:hypothetical protein
MSQATIEHTSILHSGVVISMIDSVGGFREVINDTIRAGQRHTLVS